MQRKWRRSWQQGKPHWAKCRPVTRKKGNNTNITLRLAKKLLPPVAAASLLLATMTGAYANPSGGQVTSGAGTIAQSGNTMNITQSTNKMSINWQSFNIGSGENVNFLQPGASSIALNRVIGNNASSIYGHLNANGQVFLINPNGVLFARGAQVNVGGLVATSLNLSDNDFQTGKYNFSGNGGSVVNQGTITAANGGYVTLLGGQASNQGVIVAKQGTVALGAGNAVTLDMNGDGLLSLAVTQSALGALAENKSLIQVNGGTVFMTAKAADSLAGTAVNNSGIIQAQSVNNVNGFIRLDGGTNGVVINSGTLDASGKNAGETGGSVTLTGQNIGLTTTSRIDASGSNGGGTVLVGGDWQGSGTLPHAQAVVMGSGASIDASAINTGNGGKVVLWSDQYTGFYGSIADRGGVNGGNGGQVETSSHNNLQAFGSVNASAPKGTSGNWLLDPTDVTIVSGSTNTNDTDSAGTWTPTTNTAQIGVANINADLNAGTSVTINTASAGAATGNITQNSGAAISKTAGGNASLTLNAAGAITLHDSITSSNGQLAVVLNAAGGAVSATGSSINTNGGMLTINAASGSGTISSVISGTGGLSKLGAGTLTLTGNNTYTGVTTISAGTLQIGTGTTGSISNTSSIIDNSVLIYNVNSAISIPTLSGTGTLSATTTDALTFNGAINLTGATSTVLGATGKNLTVNGAITTNGGSIMLLAAQSAAGTLLVNSSLASAGGDITLYQGKDSGGIDLIYGGNGNASVYFGAPNVSITSGGGNIDIENSQTAANSVRGVMFGSGTVVDATGTGGVGGNITVKGYTTSLNGIEESSGNLTIKTQGSGAISLAGNCPTGTGLLAGIALVGGTTDIHSQNGAINVTANASSANAGLGLGGGATVNIYTKGSGDINIAAWSAGSPISTNCGWGGATAFHIGYDGSTNVTTGNINLSMAGGSPLLNNTYLKTNGGAVTIGDNGTTLGALTLPSGMIVSSGSYKSFTLGGSKTNGVMVNTPLTTNASADTTTGIIITSTNDITIGAKIDTSATTGVPLTFIADHDVNIDADITGGTGSNLTLTADSKVTGDGVVTIGSGVTISCSDVSIGSNGFTVASTKGNVTGSDLSSMLSSGNVTISALTGDVDVYDSISWNAKKLTLADAEDINIKAVMTASGTSSLALNTGSSGEVICGLRGSGFYGKVNFLDASGNPRSGTGFLSINNHSYTVLKDIAELQAINTTGYTNTKYYALGKDIDGGGIGFTPLADGSTFAATLDGMGHTVGNLTISTTTQYYGLIGQNTGRISNIGTTFGVTAASNGFYAGGLAAYNAGGIYNSYSTGNVVTNAASSYAGGLVGYNTGNGSISRSHSSGNVTASGDSSFVGGLVGYNNAGSGGKATIDTSYYTQGSVTASGNTSYVGGLVGYNFANGGTASITSSYSEGTVTANGTASYVGGLVGANDGGDGTASILYAYSTGDVTGTGSGAYVGGLVGYNNGHGTGNKATIDTTYSVGKVTGAGGSAYVGGLVGYNQDNSGTATISQSYWDNVRSNQSSGVGTSTTTPGVSGFNTTDMQLAGTYNNWSIATNGGSTAVWRIYEGYTYPLLKVFLEPIKATANDNATVTYIGTVYHGGSGITYSDSPTLDSSGNPTLTISGTLSYAGNSQGATNAGQYTINAAGVYSVQQGYDILFNPGTFTINKAPLTVTANNDSKTYDKVAYSGGNGVTYSGFVNNETNSVLGGTLAFAGSSQTAVNAGTYAITPTGYTSGNYDITFVNGTLRVDPRPITVTATAGQKKTYGDADPTGLGTAYSITSGNLVTGDSISGSLSRATGENVGTYAINQGTLANSNYAITYQGANFAIDKAALTITADNKSRDYGDVNPTLTASYTGLKRSDTSAVVSGLTLGTTAAVTSDVGDYAITASGGTASNYTITYVDGTLSITRRPITVMAVDQSRYYGYANPTSGSVTVTSGTLANSDALSTASVSSGATSTTAAGQTAALTPSAQTFSTGSASNYAITYADGALTINKAPLAVTANNDNKTYDKVAYSGGNGVTYSGFVNNETNSVLGGTLTYDGSSQGAVNAGNYAITPTGYTSGNYDITFVNGTLTVNKAPLTVTANNDIKIYGGAAYSGGNGITYSGFVNGETSSVLGGTVTYGGDSQGAIAPGQYAITASGLSSGNYDITYQDGTLTIQDNGSHIPRVNAPTVAPDNNSQVQVVQGGINIPSVAASIATSAATPVSSDLTLTTIGGGTRSISLDLSSGTLTIKFAEGTSGGSTAPAADSNVALVSLGTTGVQAKAYYKVASSSDSVTMTDGNAAAKALPKDPPASSTGTTFSLNTKDGKVAEFQVLYADGAIRIKPLNDSAAAMAHEAGNSKKLVAASGILAVQQDLAVNAQSVKAIYLHL